MLLTDPGFWSDQIRRVFGHYDTALLRRVTGRLYKPRSQWPAEELIERGVATLDNDAVIDRRLAELEPAGRKLLALMGLSRQPRWQVGRLLELLAALGYAEGVRPVLALFEAGLLYPDLPGADRRVRDFEQWLGQASATGFEVFAHPHVTARARGEDLGLPECPGAVPEADGVQEADGLEWPLRLAVVWQQVAAGPLRLTQQGEFFKRDLDRLRSDPLLTSSAADSPVGLPDAGLLAVALAKIEGALQEQEGELQAGALPAAWNVGLYPTLESLWAALPRLETWNPLTGWQDFRGAANPYPSADLLALLLLTRLPEDAWARPAAVEQWVLGHHPFWGAGPNSRVSSGISDFLLGLAHQLRFVQTAKYHRGEKVVRLSPIGRWLLGLGTPPAPAPAFPKTLLVQPNLEVVAYRQGLTPALIAALSQFAAWKSLGPACILQLQPDTVYRALEAGWTFETILQTLHKYGMRPVPTAVTDSLRTWADKRERLSVYPSAALFEFATPQDLEEALARGLPGMRLSERLAVVPNEGRIDYRHFRLIGTRDYSLPPDQCVEVEADGVTLTIDQARSDLLLETELCRFAELLERPGPNGRRQYRMTPASMAVARERGLGLRVLEDWFGQRTGRPISPAARLLLIGPLTPPFEMQRRLILHVSAPEIADGLLQWPGTRALIQERLGPTALAVADEDVDRLQEQLHELGLSFQT
jgi:XPB/Ssl2-like helicase family protein